MLHFPHEPMTLTPNLMSTELPSIRESIARRANIAVVVSTYNERFVAPLLNNCLEELNRVLPRAKVSVFQVPGAYEIPVMTQNVISTLDVKPDVMIALGLIIRGSTAHADLVGSSVCQKLLDIACESSIPVINEVLLLDTEEQAFARCIAHQLNRGREAADAAAVMVDALGNLQEGRISDGSDIFGSKDEEGELVL